jgi:hypothetical protein
MTCGLPTKQVPICSWVQMHVCIQAPTLCNMITLVLTGGLPPSYHNFAITLDSANPTLNYVITCPLIENTCQSNAAITTPSTDATLIAISKFKAL